MLKESSIGRLPAASEQRDAKGRYERPRKRLALAVVVGAVALTGVSAKESGASYQAERGAVIERSYVDRPDLSDDPQIQAIYVKSADGEDCQIDINGKGQVILGDMNDWVTKKDRGNGKSLRLDKYVDNSGQLVEDIPQYTSQKTSAELYNMGLYIVYQFRDELWGAGFSKNPNTTYLVLYSGNIKGAGGVSTRPSEVPGNVAVLDITDNRGCEGLPVRGIYSYRDDTAVHEVTHNMPPGIVPDDAPHSDGRGHSTESNDLMYPVGDGRNRGGATVIDPGGDDYRSFFERYLTFNHTPAEVEIQGTGIVRSTPSANTYWGENFKVDAPSRSGETYTAYCEESCELWFDNNETVALTPEAGLYPRDDTWKFTGWSGDGTGKKERRITVTRKQAVTATFKPIVNFDIAVRGPGNVSMTGEKTCKSAGVKVVFCYYEKKPGTKVRLSAIATAKSVFVRWLPLKSTKPDLRLTARHGEDQELTAVFKKTSAKRGAKNK